MLILTEIYKKDGKPYPANQKYVDFDCNKGNEIFVDIYDTEKKDYFVQHWSIYDEIVRWHINNVLGMLDYDSHIVCFKISKHLWRFMDICDGFEICEQTNNPVTPNSVDFNKNILYYNDCSVITTNIKPFLKNTSISGRNLLFASRYNAYMDILDIYEYIFKTLGALAFNKKVTIKLGDKLYTVKVNKDVFAFMTKYNVAKA